MVFEPAVPLVVTTDVRAGGSAWTSVAIFSVLLCMAAVALLYGK